MMYIIVILLLIGLPIFPYLLMKHKTPEILSGDLTVSGEDRIEIELGHKRPKTVIVEFKDPPNPTPCNPQHDSVDWHCVYKHRQYVLMISWNVFDTRRIVWAVEF